MPPIPEPAPNPDAGLGSDARRTRKQRTLIAEGVHPATGFRLGPDATCGTCAHRWRKTAGNWSGWKCRYAASGRGDGPDLRLKWPACIRYEHGEPNQ